MGGGARTPGGLPDRGHPDRAGRAAGPGLPARRRRQRVRGRHGGDRPRLRAAGAVPGACAPGTGEGVGCAVDTGFRYAIGHGAELLARTDADCLPRPGWTAAARTALDRGAQLVCGRVDARRDEHGPLGRAGFRALVRVAAFFGRIRPAHHRRHGYLTPYRMHAGNNMAVTAELYQRVGGMPRRPSPTDRLFLNRVRRRQCRHRPCPRHGRGELHPAAARLRDRRHRPLVPRPGTRPSWGGPR